MFTDRSLESMAWQQMFEFKTQHETSHPFHLCIYAVIQCLEINEWGSEDWISGDRISGDRISGDRISGDRISGDRISGDQNRIFWKFLWSGDQHFFPLFRRSKVLKHYLDFWTTEKFVSHKYNQEIKILNNALKTFDLLIELVTNKFFRRLKVEDNAF